jgi:hypothetical protein
MGLLAPVKNSSPVAITTTPTDIDSTGYYYHHITIFFSSTIQTGDEYLIEYFKYDPVAADWSFHDWDLVNFVTTQNKAGTGGQLKAWELNPTPGSGFRARVTKVSGNDGTINYEIIRAA